MATFDAHQTLQTVQSDIDDIRGIASCKICLRPFYEPFMLPCGHTFCYGCLRSWVCGGDNRRRKRNCPECRAAIRQQPSPNYALRNLAHMFTDRPELLPHDETLEEHKTGKEAEAKLLADDRNGQGLFKNMFRFARLSEPLEGIWDPLDGVHRCPNCNWELEEGMCGSCGFDIGQDSLDEGDSNLDLDEGSYSEGSSWPPSDALVPMGERAARGMSPGSYRAYHPTDESDTNSEAEAIPFGYRDYMQLHGHFDEDGGDEDEDEDEDDDFDNNDDMDGFIDDGDYPDEIEFDSDSDEGEDTDDSQEPHRFRRPLFLGLERPFTGRIRIPGLGDDDDIRETSSHGPSDSDSEGTARPGINVSEDDDQQTNYDESSEDETIDAATMPQQNQNRRRRRLVICDDEDEDNDNEDESEGEAVNQQATFDSHQYSGHSSGIGSDADDSETTSGVDVDNDDSDDDEDEDGEDDEDVFSSSRTARMQRSQRLTNEDTRQDRLRQIRTSVASDLLSRNQQAERPTRHRSAHGYHPYARRNGSDRSNNRYPNPVSRPRGTTRTASVY